MQSLAQYPVILDQRVAWGDMDAFGHVNNVMYYRYIESARLLYLERLNILMGALVTVVATNQCRYLKPVVYPDQLKIGTRIDEIGRTSFKMSYILWSEQQQSIVATSEAVLVCINKHTGQKMEIPEDIQKIIRELENTVRHII
ncbi:thioesterase family protein [Acinetobacter thermotolerans]|uniref:acyl-CoA thioesterase n=1 Tax=Acinetobacter thermotolerans TaxID=3151487 RepID=UPI00325A794C